MSAEFVPTTDAVRIGYKAGANPGYGEHYRTQAMLSAEFDRWLVEHDAEVARSTLRALAAAIEAETANVDSVRTRHLIGRLYAAAETTPEGGAVGDVVPLREERCDTKHEGPFRLTSGGNGSSSVHYCTLQQGHGGKHYDGVSGQDWRG